MGGTVEHFIIRKEQILTKLEKLTHHKYLYAVTYNRNYTPYEWISFRELLALDWLSKETLATALNIDENG